jgi:hypothetical protein
LVSNAEWPVDAGTSKGRFAALALNLTTVVHEFICDGVSRAKK